MSNALTSSKGNDVSNDLSLFEGTSRCFIRQIKEWGEILIGYEGSNKYELLNESGDTIGHIAEQSSGLFKLLVRSLFKSHRPLDVRIFDKQGKEVIVMDRPFYFFFSTMKVYDRNSRLLGSIDQKFAIFRKRYELKDHNHKSFAKINSGFFSFFNFDIESLRTGQSLGHIRKRWGGLIKEIFTDSDTFGVDISNELSQEQKAIVLATAISVDFDYFEDNNSRGSLMDMMD